MSPHVRLFNYTFSVNRLGILPPDEANATFSQSGEDVVLVRIFDRKRNGFYVDVGAFHPRMYSNTCLLHSGFGWRGINIDPSAETIALFNKDRPADINIIAAVGSSHRKTTYWQFSHPGRNTIIEQNLQRQKERGDTKLIGQKEVEVFPLSWILEQRLPADTQIDLLDVDAEGADLDVLKSNDWDRFRPSVIAVEDYSMFSSGNKDSEIYRYLNSLGYRLVSHLYDTSIYCIDEFKLPGQ